MNKYEFTVIFDTDEEKTKLGLEFVTGRFEKFKAEVTKQEDLGVKTLAYQINKNDKGHYVYFELNADPETINKMSHDFLLNGNILKFLFINPEN
ncbi:MAG: 30S ribosomal protein S6 [Spirochaetales bacterium]|nr:30S ribosomal protein S6 [Spirochaetales bacterium]